jgi:L-ribulokinase
VFAAAAAGQYADIHRAKAAMMSPIEKVFTPDPRAHSAYEPLYADYRALGAFAGKLAAAR